MKRIGLIPLLFLILVIGMGAEDAVLDLSSETNAAQVGEAVQMDLTLFGNPGFCVLECEIVYDSSVLRFNEAECGTVLPAGMMGGCNGVVPGSIRMAFTGMLPATADGSVYRFQMTAIGGGDAACKIASVKMYDFEENRLPVTATSSVSLIVAASPAFDGDMGATGDSSPSAPKPSSPGGTGSAMEPQVPIKEEPVIVVPTFLDVPHDHWAYAQVEKMYLCGLVSGIGDNLFGVNQPMTRAAIVTLLYRMNGSPKGLNESGFSDVSPDAWYAESVAWAKERSVVSGLGDGRFAPEAMITREQLVTILWNYSQKPTASGDLSAFADALTASDWASEALCWAVESGLLTGKPGGLLDPKGTTTRAEATVLLERYITVKGD